VVLEGLESCGCVCVCAGICGAFQLSEYSESVFQYINVISTF